MKISFEVTEKDLRMLVISFFADKLGNIPINEDAVQILVKSKQNYRSEWEVAAFKATYEADV